VTTGFCQPGGSSSRQTPEATGPSSGSFYQPLFEVTVDVGSDQNQRQDESEKLAKKFKRLMEFPGGENKLRGACGPSRRRRDGRRSTSSSRDVEPYLCHREYDDYDQVDELQTGTVYQQHPEDRHYDHYDGKDCARFHTLFARCLGPAGHRDIPCVKPLGSIFLKGHAFKANERRTRFCSESARGSATPIYNTVDERAKPAPCNAGRL